MQQVVGAAPSSRLLTPDPTPPHVSTVPRATAIAQPTWSRLKPPRVSAVLSSEGSGHQARDTSSRRPRPGHGQRPAGPRSQPGRSRPAPGAWLLGTAHDTERLSYASCCSAQLLSAVNSSTALVHRQPCESQLSGLGHHRASANGPVHAAWGVGVWRAPPCITDASGEFGETPAPHRDPAGAATILGHQVEAVAQGGDPKQTSASPPGPPALRRDRRVERRNRRPVDGAKRRWDAAERFFQPPAGCCRRCRMPRSPPRSQGTLTLPCAGLSASSKRS